MEKTKVDLEIKNLTTKNSIFYEYLSFEKTAFILKKKFFRLNQSEMLNQLIIFDRHTNDNAKFVLPFTKENYVVTITYHHNI